MTAADKLAEALHRIISGTSEWHIDELARDALAEYEREKSGHDVHSPSIEVGGYRIPVRIEKP